MLIPRKGQTRDTRQNLLVIHRQTTGMSAVILNEQPKQILKKRIAIKWKYVFLLF